MADLLLPPWIKSARVAWRYLDSTGVSVGEFSGAKRTAARGGDRLGASLEFSPAGTSSTTAAQERASLIALLARLRGRQNRVWITNPARKLRGSFPAAELLSNNTFADGTTGWTAVNGVLTVADRMARLTATTPAANVQFYRSVALTQYAPHVLRSMILDGTQSAGLTIGPSIYDSVLQASDYQTSRGLRTAMLVASSASAAAQSPAVFSSTSGFTAGAYIEVPWTSLSRCALVDNGPNLLLQSDDFTTTWANMRSTDAANSTAAPDGTTTADSIIEDATASNSHLIAQSVTVASAAADYAFSVSIKAGTRTFVRVLMEISPHDCYVDVNLSTGAIGTATASGANWTNPRAFVVGEGNGWYRVTIIGRKASGVTSVGARVYLATALGTISYSGDGTSLIYAWRASLAQSGVPVRGVQTTTAAAAATAQTGSAIYVKGLPASTNGLLLPGDEFQIGNELKLVTAALDSDAAGLGHLQFEPPLRTASVNDGPVIIHEPMGRFLFTGGAAGWDSTPGIVTRASAEFEEV